MRKRTRLWNFLILLLVIILGFELYLPRLAAGRLEEIIKREVESAAELNISVQTFPAIKILIGKMDRVHIIAGKVKHEGLEIEAMEVAYENVILHEETFSGDNTFLDINITETALNNYLARTYPEYNDFKLTLQQDKVILAGKIKFFEASINLLLSGGLKVEDVNKVSFVPRDFQVEDIRISAELLQRLVKDIGFSFDFNQLEIPLRIEEVKIYPGQIVISGD